MPKWPIPIIGALFGFIWWKGRQAQANPADEDFALTADEPVQVDGRSDGLEIVLGADLAEAWRDQRGPLLERIAAVRKAHVTEYGVPLPPVRVIDGEGTGSGDYEIRLFGTRFGMMAVHPDRLLAVPVQDPALRIEGLEVQEPTIGQTAFWITPARVAEARERGFAVAEPAAVMMAHFADVVRAEAARLLSRPVVTELIDAARLRQPGLIDDLIPAVLSLADVQRVLRNLLAEGVSIAQLDLILENLLDLARNQRDPDELSESLRQRIGFAICNKLRGRHRELAVLSLDPRLENELSGALANMRAGPSAGVDPRTADGLIRRLAPSADRMFREGRAPVLLCGAEIRRAIKTLTQRAIPRLSVISVAEIPERIDLSSFDVVKVDG